MTGLSRCGRVYTLDEALRVAEARSLKTGKAHKMTSCAFGEHWHVVLAAKLISRPVKRYRPDPFPPLVAKLIDARDGGLCQRCGSGGRLERHHRRAKGSGGSKARSHTQCPCNALSLCWKCHRWAHEHPGKAKGLGIVVPQSVTLPGRVGVERYSAGREFIADEWSGPAGIERYEVQFAADEQWLTCSGQWVHCPAETEDE